MRRERARRVSWRVLSVTGMCIALSFLAATEVMAEEHDQRLTAETDESQQVAAPTPVIVRQPLTPQAAQVSAPVILFPQSSSSSATRHKASDPQPGGVIERVPQVFHLPPPVLVQPAWSPEQPDTPVPQESPVQVQS